MSFVSDLKSDFSDVFCDTDEFGENIVYTAKRPDYIESTASPGSGDKTIPARVVRFRVNPEVQEGGRAFLGTGLEIYISKDATDGIATLQIGLDKVTIPIRRGETAVELRVTKILSETPGMWHLKVTE